MAGLSGRPATPFAQCGFVPSSDHNISGESCEEREEEEDSEDGYDSHREDEIAILYEKLVGSSHSLLKSVSNIDA